MREWNVGVFGSHYTLMNPDSSIILTPGYQARSKAYVCSAYFFLLFHFFPFFTPVFFLSLIPDSLPIDSQIPPYCTCPPSVI